MVISIKTWGEAKANDIASHASTSASVLNRLSKHSNVKVRMAVADNENTGINTSRLLAEDGNADLRYGMAENHHIDRSILEFLATDANPFVADRAQKTILRIEQAIKTNSIALCA